MTLEDYFDDMCDDIGDHLDLLDEALMIAEDMPAEVKKDKQYQKFLKLVQQAAEGLTEFLELDECEGDECEIEEAE